MKITDLTIFNEIEFSIEKRQQQEYTLLSSFSPTIDGYSIFQYNRKTKELSIAEFRTSDLYEIGGINNKKIDTQKHCVYIEALNIKNALKRLKKGKVFFSS